MGAGVGRGLSGTFLDKDNGPPLVFKFQIFKYKKKKWKFSNGQPGRTVNPAEDYEDTRGGSRIEGEGGEGLLHSF